MDFHQDKHISPKSTHHNNHHHHPDHQLNPSHRLPSITSNTTDAHHHHPINHDHKLCNRISFRLFMSEFFGTFIFVYLGQSTLTSFELVGTQNDTISRQLASILTYGSAYLFAIILTLNLSGAHLNPAYSFASAAFGYLKWGRALNYLCAQYLGSFTAAFFLHTTYNDKLNQRHTEGLLNGMNSTLKAHGNILSTGKLFSSYPPTEVSLTQLTISYTLASAHLMLILLAIQESKIISMPQCIKPIYMSAALILIQAAFAANGGPVLNPAQDFSPRLYISFFGWGLAAFNLYYFSYWWLCGIVAPHLGGLIGFGLYQILSHLNDPTTIASINRKKFTNDDDEEEEDADDEDDEEKTKGLNRANNKHEYSVSQAT